MRLFVILAGHQGFISLLSRITLIPFAVYRLLLAPFFIYGRQVILPRQSDNRTSNIEYFVFKVKIVSPKTCFRVSVYGGYGVAAPGLRLDGEDLKHIMRRSPRPGTEKTPDCRSLPSGLWAGAPAPGKNSAPILSTHWCVSSGSTFQRGYLNTAHKHAEMEMIAKGQARAPRLANQLALLADNFSRLTSISPQMRIKRHHAQTVINNKQVAINAHFAGKDNPTIIGRRNFRIAYGSQIKARCRDSQSACPDS